MRNLILIIVVFLFVGCKNNEQEYLEVIKENNENLIDQIDTYNFKLKQKSHDQPIQFEKLHRDFNEIVERIYKIKNYSDYQSSILRMKQIAAKNDVIIEYKEIKDDNLVILKNNLFNNFIKFYTFHEIKISNLGSSHCKFGKRIKTTNYTENDSINFDFEARYFPNYNVVIDSIVDSKTLISGINSKRTNKFWKVKFKPKTNNVTIYWKVFLTEEFSDDTILVQKESQTISK